MSTITKSGRVVKNSKDDKLAALEILERQRRGEKVSIPVKEEEPLFDYEEGEGVDIDDDDISEEDFYSEDDDLIDDDVTRKKKHSSKSKKKSNFDKQATVDPKQSSLTSFLAKVPKVVKQEVSVDQDAILDQMLLDVQSVEPLKPVRKPDPKGRLDFETKRRKVELPAEFDDEFIESGPVAAFYSEIKTEELESNVETVSDENGGSYERFYWYDCFEDEYKFPGVLYLFGKVLDNSTNRYVSCSAIVKNCSRSIYIPLKTNSYEDVLEEFLKIHAKRYKITILKSQKVTKRNAFFDDPDIPPIGDYLMIEYPATQTILPSNISGETFNRILNTNQSLIEKFILEFKLHGPCWFKIYNATKSSNPITWSKHEIILNSTSDIQVDTTEDLKKPYFSVFCLSVRSYSNPITKQIEIISIAGMFNNGFFLDECLKRNNKATGHFCVLAKPTNRKDLKIPYDFHQASKKYSKTHLRVVDSERDLLIEFMQRFFNLDPDIVVGHDLINYELETLVLRMKALKVGDWSKLGRFKRSELPTTKAGVRNMFSGRVMSDTRISAMELIHARSYDLTELTKQVLDKKRTEYDHESLMNSFKSSEALLKLIDSNWEDVDSVFSILVELNVIPLAYKITLIAGNTLGRTLMGGRSERNEFLLMHAFYGRDFLCPEKLQSKYGQKHSTNKNNMKNAEENSDQQPIRKKAAYAGGLVLEPKVGFYDNYILLMDFNSLYPSIIQEFNICFSTVSKPGGAQSSDTNVELIASVPDDGIEIGVLPKELKNLVDRRREVKQLIAATKQPEKILMLDIEQKALKLTANSMYGCLGFVYSRFYAKHLASLVTFKGREILMNTRLMVEKLGYEVIYGDTDSLMINTKLTDFNEVMQKGTAIKVEVNRTFRLLEIDIDGVYRPLLLLKKKNYAGMMVKQAKDGQLSSVLETKGIDTVRRDRAVIARHAGDVVLKELLSSTDKDLSELIDNIHNYLKQLAQEIRSGQVSNEKFLISKQLNRNPEEYKDTKALGHVVLANRYNANSNNTKKFRSGDTVEYVICVDGSTESPNQRAYTLKEMEENASLTLDIEYYLCQQIHPVMVRILGNLPTTNPYVLAEQLGVEKSTMVHIPRTETRAVQMDQLASKGASRFNACLPFNIKCPNCCSPIVLSTRTTLNKSSKQKEMTLTCCGECNYNLATSSTKVVQSIVREIKQLTSSFYNSKYVCENCECLFETRNVFGRCKTDSSADDRESLNCDACDATMLAKISDQEHCLQLRFLSYLLDVEKEVESSGLKVAENVIDMYKSCKREADYALSCSKINVIDLKVMFEPLVNLAK